MPFRSAAPASASDQASLVIPKPAGVVDGDVLLAIIEVGSIGLPTAITPPTGWTLIQQSSESTGSNTYRFYAFTKVASGEGADYAFTTPETNFWAGGIAAYYGVDQVTPVNASSVNPVTSPSADQVATSITTTVANTILVGCFTKGFYDCTWTPPSGMTKRIDQLVGGDWGNCMLADMLQSAASASGDQTATASISASGTGILIALAPGGPSISASVAESVGATDATGASVIVGNYLNAALAEAAAAFDITDGAIASVGPSSAPRIFFSDLDSGPNSGGENGDGVYVTIKGKNFGPFGGGNNVTVGGGAVAAYKLWTDTQIIFQLGAACGTGKIVVTTTEGSSNGPTFTVRAGGIYFVAVGANGVGTFADPMSPGSASSAAGAYARMATDFGSGPTFYFRGGTYDQNYSGGGIYGYRNYSLDTAHGGVAGFPMAMVGYPNETALCQYLDISRSNIGMNNGGSPASYVTFANFSLNGGSATFEDGGFFSNPHSGGTHIRLINCIHQAFYGTSNTMTGVILIQNDYWKVLGNEMRNTGSGTPINNNHGIYNQAGASFTEIAWNYFHDLRMGHVIQVHTDPYFSYYGVSIHDNVIAKGATGDSRAMNVGNANGDSYGWIYNNIIDQVGQDFSAIAIWSGSWKIYHNTMYRIPVPGSAMIFITNAAYTAFGAPASWLPAPNCEVRNNIFYSDGSPYFSISTSAPACSVTMDHNLYFGAGAPPPQDTSPTLGDPVFVNAVGGDFHIQFTSAAKDAGTSAVSAVVTSDHDGVDRPQGAAYDIGAFEYIVAGLNALVAESVIAVDTENSSVTGQFAGSVAESAGAADTTISQDITSSAVSEAAAASDFTVVIEGQIGVVNEAGSANDAPTASVIFTVRVDEARSITDTTMAQVVDTAAVQESAAASSVAAAQAVDVAAASETATAADLPSATLGPASAVAEAASAADSTTGVPLFSVQITEAGVASDSATAVAVAVAGMIESLTGLDLTSASAQMVAAVAEAVSAVDLPVGGYIITATVTEIAQAIDSASGIIIGVIIGFNPSYYLKGAARIRSVN
jgi:hypothetical protein